MAQIEILSEQEQPGRWRFAVQVLDEAGTLRQHQVTLAWSDYNRWSADGADDPNTVVDAAINFLLTQITPGDLPPRFDASLARRRFGDKADQVIPTLIGR